MTVSNNRSNLMFKPQRYPTTRNAFTIIELLVVLGIIVVLAGITFGLMSGAQERGRTSRAQAELRALAQALEQYQGQYGDYPWVEMPGVATNEEVLFNALAGIVGPTGDPIRDDSGATRVGRVYVDFSRFSIGDRDNEALSEAERDELPRAGETSPGVLERRFLDPWGNPYRYYYKSRTEQPDFSWERRGFVLYSAGPSGEHREPGNDGVMPDRMENDDNIYFDD